MTRNWVMGLKVVTGKGDILELNFLGAVVAILASVVLIVIGERTGAIRRHFADD